MRGSYRISSITKNQQLLAWLNSRAFLTPEDSLAWLYECQLSVDQSCGKRTGATKSIEQIAAWGGLTPSFIALKMP